MDIRQFGATLLFLLASVAAHGCSCWTITEDSAAITAAAREYDVVFIGEVVQHGPGESRFRIVRRFKGLDGKDFVYTGEFDSCSTLYKEGYHLIYADWEGDQLHTSYCSPNKALQPRSFPAAQVRAAGGTDAFLQHYLGATDPHVAQLERLFAQPVTAPPWGGYPVVGIGGVLLLAGLLWLGLRPL